VLTRLDVRGVLECDIPPRALQASDYLGDSQAVHQACCIIATRLFDGAASAGNAATRSEQVCSLLCQHLRVPKQESSTISRTVSGIVLSCCFAAVSRIRCGSPPGR
jgi:hypothetical protein